MFGVKDKLEAEAFEVYGFKWMTNAFFDTEEYGSGYWSMLGGTFRIVPHYFAEEDAVEYEIWKYGRVLEFDERTLEPCKILKFDAPMLVYSGSIDVEDKDFIYKLLLNLQIIFEPDFDEDGLEPMDV